MSRLTKDCEQKEKKVKRGLVLLFIALVFALPAMAQEVGSVSGTVSTEDRNPVAGAAVAIWDDERNHQETRTDEDGEFAFERVAAGAWNIRAEMERMEPAQDEIEVAANENTEVDLVLGGGGGGDDGVGSVSGMVINERREAVGGVAITLMNERREVVGETETDDAGEFSFEEVDAGSYTVLAQLGDLAALEQIRVAADQNTEVILVLGDGGGDDGVGSVSGTVFNQRREAVAGVAITIMNDRREVVGETETDDAGEFSFEEVDAGGYTVLAQHGDLSALEQIRVVGDQNTEVNLLLGGDDGGGDQLGTVIGRVTTADDEAAVRAIVRLWLEAGDRAVIAGRGVTGERGGFAFRVAAGDYHITAELEEVGVAEDNLNVAAGEITEVNLVLGEGELDPRYNAVEDKDVALPISALLLNSYPNPFNAIATVNYQLPVAAKVSLSVFNTDGRQVQTLINIYQIAGEYQTEFNAGSLTTGAYILRLEAGNQARTMKLMLLK